MGLDRQIRLAVDEWNKWPEWKKDWYRQCQ